MARLKTKYLILSLVLILIPLSLYAWNTAIMSGGVPSDACSTPSTGDELNEGFLGAGYEAGMTDNQGNPDEDHALSGSPPTGSCSEGVQFVAVDGADVSSEWDKGSIHDISAGSLDIGFEFYINSHSMGDYNNFIFLNWDDDTAEFSTGSSVLRLRYTGTDLQIYADGSTNSTYVTLSTGTWYTGLLHMDSTSANSYLQITGGGSTTCDVADECPFTDNATDCRYLRIGPGNIYGTDDLTAEFGYVYIDSP